MKRLSFLFWLVLLTLTASVLFGYFTRPAYGKDISADKWRQCGDLAAVYLSAAALRDSNTSPKIAYAYLARQINSHSSYNKEYVRGVVSNVYLDLPDKSGPDMSYVALMLCVHDDNWKPAQ